MMKFRTTTAALGALAFFATSQSMASEVARFDCGDASAGIALTVTSEPELGSTILNRNGQEIALTRDGDGSYRDPNPDAEARFFPPDFPRDVMGSKPPLLMLGVEHFGCERVTTFANSTQSAAAGNGGSFVNMQGRSLGGKLRAGPGTNYQQSGSTGFKTPLTIVRNTGVRFDGYDWFEVQLSSGKRAFQWGGIMCSEGQQIAGIYDRCDRVPD